MDSMHEQAELVAQAAEMLREATRHAVSAGLYFLALKQEAASPDGFRQTLTASGISMERAEEFMAVAALVARASPARRDELMQMHLFDLIDLAAFMEKATLGNTTKEAP